MSATPPSSSIALTRVYDAPLATVWAVWTDPAHLARWWGPRGFTLTTHRKDTRTGGSWHYTMHGPDGTDYECTTQYLEVVPLAKLVYDHGGHADRPPLFRVTVVFTALAANLTRMDMTSTLPSPEIAAEMRRFIKKAGGDSTWDRLAEYLELQLTGAEKFVIARAFDVSRDRMFALWTTPQHLVQWLPPAGFTMQFIECDLRAGGGGFYVMTNGSLTMHGLIRYLAISPPSRLVYTQQFADEQKRVSRHPLAPTWPETMLTAVDLAEEGPDRTRVTVSWQPSGPATPEEIAAFVKMRGSMTQGWTGSFDKLETYLALA